MATTETTETMTPKDMEFIQIALADTIREHGLTGLNYEMETRSDAEGTEISFKNSTGTHRSFRIKLEAL